jgi:hypothetical protein
MTHYELGKGASAPFPAQSGPVLVCGNAWCLSDDLARVRIDYPDAPVIVVNGAAAHVKAQFLFTQHPRKLGGWIVAQRTRFHNDFTTHASGSLGKLTKLGKPVRDYGDLVQYWWPDARSAGSSGWAARILAKLMGFDEVILCGVPISLGSYEGGKLARDWQREATVKHYQAAVLRDTAYHEGVRSMSGWTREMFGEPDGSIGGRARYVQAQA